MKSQASNFFRNISSPPILSINKRKKWSPNFLHISQENRKEFGGINEKQNRIITFSLPTNNLSLTILILYLFTKFINAVLPFHVLVEIALVAAHIAADITGIRPSWLDPLVLALDVRAEIALVRAHILALGTREYLVRLDAVVAGLHVRLEIAPVRCHIAALITGKLFRRLDPLVLTLDVWVEITLVGSNIVTLRTGELLVGLDALVTGADVRV